MITCLFDEDELDSNHTQSRLSGHAVSCVESKPQWLILRWKKVAPKQCHTKSKRDEFGIWIGSQMATSNIFLAVCVLTFESPMGCRQFGGQVL